MSAKRKPALGFAPELDFAARFEAKLASSGLTLAHAAQLGYRLLSKDEAHALRLWPHHRGLESFLLPYRDPWTGEPLRPRPGHPGFFRARALRDASEVVLQKDEKFQKYNQPADTGVAAYFPTLSHLRWPAILDDPDRPLLLTEGELKAAAASALTDDDGEPYFPTVGLGGVANFVSRQTGHPLFLPELERITWVRRHVYLVYDSDLRVNPQVQQAARRLAHELERRGAYCHLLLLPVFDPKKTGLDDYLLRAGAAGLLEELEHAELVGAVDVLFDLNERYAVARDGDLADFRELTKLPLSQLERVETGLYSQRRFEGGRFVSVTVKAGEAWLEWPLRNIVDRLAFEPTREPRRIIELPNGSRVFNIWGGLAVEPAPGDVAPFLELIDHLFTGGEGWEKNWFLDWLAYPLQHLGAKLLTATVMYGLVQGSGKTLIGETMRRIYGRHYTKIGQKQLVSDFNLWAEGKLFILGDDITGLNRHELHDALKVMITQTTVMINPKRINPYELPDYANYYFTSNRANAFILDNEDRRFFVWEVPSNLVKKPRAFFTNYLAWLDGPGPAALLDWFLRRDLSGFDPGDAAPTTGAKIRMRDAARGDVETWVSSLIADPDTYLAYADGLAYEADILTISQLKLAYAYFAGIDPVRAADDLALSKRFGHALAEAKALDIGVIRKGGSIPKAARYYVVRNLERWRPVVERRDLDAIRAHLAGESGKKPGGKKY